MAAATATLRGCPTSPGALAGGRDWGACGALPSCPAWPKLFPQQGLGSGANRLGREGAVSADGDAQVRGQLLDDGVGVGAGHLLQQGQQALQDGKVTRLQLRGGEEQWEASSATGPLPRARSRRNTLGLGQGNCMALVAKPHKLLWGRGSTERAGAGLQEHRGLPQWYQLLQGTLLLSIPQSGQQNIASQQGKGPSVVLCPGSKCLQSEPPG